MTDVALKPTYAVHPATGEALDLDRPLGDLAGFLDAVRDMESRAREAKAIVTQEILDRMDTVASWTAREDGYEIKGDGPGRVEYDGELLANALAALVIEGKLSAEAASKACNEVVTYKPRAAGINALKKLGGEVREVIEALEEPVPEAKRRVSVRRRDA